jgi:aspartyl-tRNA synthetase
MYRTNTCGELRAAHCGQEVTLAGWVQRVRDLGAMSFLDLRDRYGITQLVTDEKTPEEIRKQVSQLGREFVIQAKGIVRERSSKNVHIPTGDIEVEISSLKVLSASSVPPFTIQNDTDGGDDLRMKYRYLDLRRPSIQQNLFLRAQMAHSTRSYLAGQGFIEVETPVMIKSTPEGARDFVVPSRMNPGQFYALPQSPQILKQLLMVAGFDKYFQIVKCFRDEDLRADRQPEFTQIDCEMSFVEQNDVLNTFEGLTRHLLKDIKGIETDTFPRMPYSEAMSKYGSDKPDIRFGMELVDITSKVKGKGFPLFDTSDFVGGICSMGCSEYSRKQMDELTEWVKRPQIGAKGLIFIKIGTDGVIKSSMEKYLQADELKTLAAEFDAKPGDMIMVIPGEIAATQGALGLLRVEMGNRLGLRPKDTFQPLWVVDFPLLEWNEEARRWSAMHHPFTSPKPEDIPMLNTDPGNVRANAYDLVINGVEIGGGSVRIFDSALQALMFKVLGFTPEQAEAQFGFLMNAFKYGAPPHAGIAFGFDRLVSMFAGLDSIRDVIAFPKNNSGRDVMNDSPSVISDEQLKELHLLLNLKA